MSFAKLWRASAPELERLDIILGAPLCLLSTDPCEPTLIHNISAGLELLFSLVM